MPQVRIQRSKVRGQKSEVTADTRPLTSDFRLLTGGFTLLETLIVVAVIAMFVALLTPGLRSVRAQARALKCASNLRSTAVGFQLFVEGLSEPGALARSKSAGGISIDDFQESLYRLDEYWDLGDAATGPLRAGDEMVMCPAGSAELTRRRGFPCGREAISPLEHVTLAANMRLRNAVTIFAGRPVLAPASVTRVAPDILLRPSVPLLIDVDAKLAIGRGLEPFYTAPPARNRTDPYSAGRYWLPAFRHSGRVNVAFVGGHVLSSSRPETETWDWTYQGQVGR